MPRRSTISLRQLCTPNTPLSHVVDLLAAKQVHTPQQLSENIHKPKIHIVGFIKGHVFHGNNPAHVLTVTAQAIAKFLFPDSPDPADKLARIVKGIETGKVISTTDASPAPNSGTSNGKYAGLRVGSGVTVGYQPAPGRPYLVCKDGKWELLKAPKNP